MQGLLHNDTQDPVKMRKTLFFVFSHLFWQSEYATLPWENLNHWNESRSHQKAAKPNLAALSFKTLIKPVHLCRSEPVHFKVLDILVNSIQVNYPGKLCPRFNPQEIPDVVRKDYSNDPITFNAGSARFLRWRIRSWCHGGAVVAYPVSHSEKPSPLIHAQYTLEVFVPFLSQSSHKYRFW